MPRVGAAAVATVAALSLTGARRTMGSGSLAAMVGLAALAVLHAIENPLTLIGPALWRGWVLGVEPTRSRYHSTAEGCSGGRRARSRDRR